MPLSPKFESQGDVSLQVESLCVNDELGKRTFQLAYLLFFIFATFITVDIPANVIINPVVFKKYFLSFV